MIRRIAIVIVLIGVQSGWADDPSHNQPKSTDHRISDKPRDLNGYFPFQPPDNLASWNQRRAELKVQLQVALGLWPMPEREPVNPVIHGMIDRDEYTVEKVYFASMPGHYVTGNLFRPKSPGKHAAVLCPHGHWANGRMHDAGEKAAKQSIESGAETWNDSARFLLQAKCVQLARMGCVVFHYDMLGYADSKAVSHDRSFIDAESLLWLHSHMSLQTWNSLRALDFVCGLQDVDPTRVGCTGGSGGGTQTFILSALDERIAAAFPAVMVSTAMQGGCVCENAPYLRIGTGNVEIAALTAPRPLGMTGANDWTIDIERKGLPELKALYSLYGAGDRVTAKCFPKYGHNYNQVSRELMYAFFNEHLNLGLATPVKEREFRPIPPKELSVFDKAHPRPSDEVGADEIRKTATAHALEQLANLLPETRIDWSDPQHPLRRAVKAMIGDSLSSALEIESREVAPPDDRNGIKLHRIVLGRKRLREAIPAIIAGDEEHATSAVVWIHPAGKNSLFQDGKIDPTLAPLFEARAIVVAIDALGTGEATYTNKVDGKYAGYTFGYNRPLLAERVHDILTAVAYAKSLRGVKHVHLVGWESAGPWVAIARSLCGDAVDRTAADLDRFRFENVRTPDDPMMLPGALKYGGLATFAAQCAPHDLLLHNHSGTQTGEMVPKAYRAFNAASHLKREPKRMTRESVIAWLQSLPAK